jgi:hypothetical protein
MNTIIEYTDCPSCGSSNTADLLPPDKQVPTTLDLIYERGRSDEFSHVDFSPIREATFAICRHCAVMFIRRRSTPEAAREYYGQLFHVIEAPLPFDTLPLPSRFLERRIKVARGMARALDEHGVLSSVESVLCVRCNAGEFLKTLRDDYGHSELYAMEYLPSLRRHASEVWGLENVVPLYTPEFENPFPREKFDLIVCNEEFAHAHAPVRLADYLKSLLTDKGVLVAFNEKDHTQVLREPKLFKHGMNFFHKQLFTPKSLRAFFALRGFAVESLPHPTMGDPAALKESKLLYVARPSSSVEAALPSDEVDEVARIFRDWWKNYQWYKRKLRIRAFFKPGVPSPTGGGEARHL